MDGEESCCGPDATLWLFQELANHYTYAASMSLEVGPGFIADGNSVGDIWDNGVIAWDNDIQRRIAAVWQLMAYGLAVDYANLDYRDLQRRSAAVDTCNSQVRWRCEENRGLGQEPTISVCGECQNATDYGNFVFGVVLQAAEEAPAMAGLAGLIFNFGQEGVLDHTKPDVRGVLAGYDIASSFSALLNSPYDRNQFCNALRSTGRAWRETPHHDQKRCNIACGPQGPNLNYAPHSITHWNSYVSALTGDIHMSTPYEEAVDFVRNFLN